MEGEESKASLATASEMYNSSAHTLSPQTSSHTLKVPSKIDVTITDGGSDENKEEEEEEIARRKAIASTSQLQFAERKPRKTRETFPPSYRQNSARELDIVTFVNEFSKQFRLLYNNRKPLFILVPNECNAIKCVCATVRSTMLPYESLNTHEGAAKFVSSYISYQILDPPVNPPSRLVSPATTLWNQKGNCFDMSVLLCSILEGAGYDAYCVYGYATREVCLADRTKIPADSGPVSSKPAAPEPKKENKYKLKKMSKLSSDYEQRMKERELKKEAEAKLKAQQEAEEIKKAQQLPVTDSLSGLRVHCWVLVREGKRGVPETFFIEPTTGETCSPYHKNYKGIEAVWNSKNYWVNMQDCTHGLGDMQYMMGNSAGWEFVFPGDSVEPKEGHRKCPDLSSWVEELEIDMADYETGCPNGMRTLIELGCKTEIFADYLLADGMTKKVSRYSDVELTKVESVVASYTHRKDRLHTRRSTYQENAGVVTEQIDEEFYKGAVSHLRHHTFFECNGQIDSSKGDKMYFFHDARVDGLEKRIKSTGSLKESFRDREDKLVSRSVEYSTSEEDVQPVNTGRRRSQALVIPKVQISIDVESSSKQKEETVIVEMTEVYDRNPSKPAHEDIKEITYLDDALYVTYHTDDKHITTANEVLEKPQLTEKQEFPPISQDEVERFVVNSDLPPTRNFENAKILENLLAMEKKCRKAVGDGEQETKDILSRLEQDNDNVKLELSFYDTTRNAESKARRERLEEEAKEEAIRLEEMSQDYLAPFLLQRVEPHMMTDEMIAKVDIMLEKGAVADIWKHDGAWSPEILDLYQLELEYFLTRSMFDDEDVNQLKFARKQFEAQGIKKRCLEDLQKRLEQQARLIQEWYDKESLSLHKKRKWYEENKDNDTLKESDVQEYTKFCEEALFRLKILEDRLARHKEEASRRYVKLDHTLRNDKRLAQYLS
eukprot:m.153424 g.153424  ORF g.153424 m.153424 type:complete len:947 (-) comp15065_c0_seq6:746-3586(-)